MHPLLRAATGAVLATGVLGCLPALVGVGASGSAASAPIRSPYIVGGTRAPNTPWEVQLEFTRGQGVYDCTGEQVDARWVLTARHCIDGTDTMTVFQSNSTGRRGRAHPADAWLHAPHGDIALVHLARSAPLPRYAHLGLTYRARSSGRAVIMGYGLRADRARPTGLYRASVALDGRGVDAYRGRAQHLRGIDGAANHGDSGGALVLDSDVVAVCSTGDRADPGTDRHAGASYAILAQSRSWIERTTGR